MKETLRDLKERRSCRSYEKEQIKTEELDAVLEAGMYAPTGRGLQSPIMVVVQDPETIKMLSKMNAKVLGNENIDPFFGAPTIVIVLADKTINTYREDGSLVMGNLMNAAHAIGLGSCWIHRAREVFDTEEGREMLRKWGVSDNYEGIGNCLLGYAHELAPLKPRKENYVIRV